MGSLYSLKPLITVFMVLTPLGGCATVSLYEPVSAEVSLVDGASPLQEPSDAFCRLTREKGLATGEASLASLTDILTGKDRSQGAYWRLIGADKGAPSFLITRIRGDVRASADGIDSLTTLAQSLMNAGASTRADVTYFERALIHARQARDAMSDALVQVNKRSQSEYRIVQELAPLDEAITRARRTADALAASRAPDTQPAAASS